MAVVPPFIGERNIVELNSVDEGPYGERSCGVGDLRRSTENLLQPLHRRSTTLDQREHPTESGGGPSEDIEIRDEGNDVGHQQIAPDHPYAAVPNHDQHG